MSNRAVTKETTHQVNLTSNRIRKGLSNYWTLSILVLIIAIFGVIEPRFLSRSNWLSTTTYMTETMLLGISETFVIITAGIDLSVGAIEGLAGVVAALVILKTLAFGTTLSLIFGVVFGLVVGMLVGLVNGLVITKMKITPFITTLGTMGVATGLTFIFSGGTDVVGLPASLNVIGNLVVASWFNFTVIITMIVLALAGIWLSKTRFGQYTYAIGSNAEASRRAGIRVDNHLIKVYMLSGLIASLSGILLLTRFATASPLTGANSELNAIAAVVIGGASLFGGRGTMFGTLVGAGIISVLVTGLVIVNVQPYWQVVAIGVIIILAVWFDQLNHRPS
ncbi:ABC transporter permease [Alicyclobacillaceae bacterium I2511]|nr:ABC transporter permease [Alicyclobacillaceae bacterium I2511]